MYSTVSSFKGILKIKETVVDNGPFKLHYKITSLILMLFSAIVTTHQFFGDPIDCFVAMKDELPDKLLDNYCWVQSTFTLPGAQNKKVGDEVIYPGVDKSVPGEERVYHSYYQWVWVFLFVQSVCFYMPHYIWKIFEGKTIQHLLLNLASPYPQEEKEDGKGNKLETELEKLTKYLRDSKKKHKFYAFQYVLCEVLNVANVIGQMFCTDTFLGGEFTTYGTEVIQFSRMDQPNRTDPMIAVFPRMTKCTFSKYGVAGSVQQHSALCILPINMFNEKIFIFLWFWFIVLAVVSCLVVVVRILLICFSRLRYWDTKLNCTYTEDSHLSAVINRQSYTEWFVLHLLSKNMSPLNFSQLIKDLAKSPSQQITNKSQEHQLNNPKQDEEFRLVTQKL